MVIVLEYVNLILLDITKIFQPCTINETSKTSSNNTETYITLSYLAL